MGRYYCTVELREIGWEVVDILHLIKVGQFLD
jgi:hypothetical protein